MFFCSLLIPGIQNNRDVMAAYRGMQRFHVEEFLHCLPVTTECFLQLFDFVQITADLLPAS